MDTSANSSHVSQWKRIPWCQADTDTYTYAATNSIANWLAGRNCLGLYLPLVEQAPLTDLGDVLVELGPAPTVIRPFGAGMTPHGQAVVGRSVHQKLGQVKLLLSIFHTDTLCANNRALPVIHGLIARLRRVI